MTTELTPTSFVIFGWSIWNMTIWLGRSTGDSGLEELHMAPYAGVKSRLTNKIPSTKI